MGTPRSTDGRPGGSDEPRFDGGDLTWKGLRRSQR